MSYSSRGNTNSLEMTSLKCTVENPLTQKCFPNKSSVIPTDINDEDCKTETNSTSNTDDDSEIRSVCSSIYENEVTTPQTLKDWLTLVKTLLNRNKHSQNENAISKKIDELQDFFYFLALEYFSTEECLDEFIKQKRFEFVNNWSHIINGCDEIFDLLLEVIDDIDLTYSFTVK